MEKKYIKGLDGLRALAVIMVIGYHLKLPFFKGGVLGVTVFFVISGFLITRLLLQELHENNKIDLKRFWVKRIRRIWPAMLFMVSVVIIVTAIFNRPLFTKASKDFVSVIFGFNNWYQIFNNMSYFDQGGAASPLLHCWSLAIETQFYLIFPLVIVLFSKLNEPDAKKKKHLMLVTLLLIIVSSLLMFILFDPTGDPTRIYYGLDTRAFSLLVGAMLAMIHFYYPRLRLSYQFSTIISIASLLGIFIMVAQVAGYEAFLYKGGYLLASVLTAFVIAGILKQKGWLTYIFSLPILEWIGKLSYSIYLWHYPLIILLTGGKKASVGMMILEVVLTFVMASFSYYFIETPIRYHLFSNVLQAMKEHTVFASNRTKKQFSIACLVVSLFVVSIVSVRFVPKESMSERMSIEAKVKEKKKKVVQPKTEVTNQETDEEILNRLNIFMVGDSVSLGAQSALQNVFPNGRFDCKESRQCQQGVEMIQNEINQNHWQGDAIIFALGTNGPISDELDQLQKLIKSNQHLFILTLHDPYVDWIDANNQKIKAICKKYKNIHLVDWDSYCTGHNEWLYSDETHIKPDGANEYANCVKQSVLEVYKKQQKSDKQNKKTQQVKEKQK